MLNNYAVRLKITFQKDDNIVRVVDVPKEKSLEFLHLTMLACFELSPGEISSFWVAMGKNWNRTMEIPLIREYEKREDGQEQEEIAVMEDVKIGDAISESMPRLIYEYDPMLQWDFRIEWMEDRPRSEQFEYPILAHENGKSPDHNKAKIEFIHQSSTDTSSEADENIFLSGGGFLDSDDDYDYDDE